ncbi:MAG TPA: hypothetical protein VMA95_12760 [Streptosporangiaceae bacterium]|nr:hypothetical protein [Streptosporangiaceae bacterium]
MSGDQQKAADVRAWAKAAQVLAERDQVIRRLVAETGLPEIHVSSETPFEALLRAVVYQQLAGRAAAAIHGRLVSALDGKVTPAQLLTLTPEAMRAAGLSARKVSSLRDLAAKVEDGMVTLDPVGIRDEADDLLIERLTTVPGIGIWTVQMFLIFQLQRLDIWPVGDLGVRKGYGLGWGVPTPTPKQLDPLGEPFRPYRSVLTWYCWRAAERYGGAADSALTR